MIQRWTNEEDTLLKELFKETSKSDLEKAFPNRSYDGIRRRANLLGVKKVNSSYYSKDEEKYLMNNYADKSIDEIIKVLNRTAESIYVKAEKLGLSKISKWSNEEIKVLEEVYAEYSNEEISQIFLLKRSTEAIGERGRAIGLNKSEEFYKKFTKNELIEYLQGYAKILGRTPINSELLHNENMPSPSTYARYFGSYEKACLEANLDINTCLFGKYGKALIAKDGNTVCYSKSELIITDFLLDNNISFEKEKSYSDILNKELGYKRCDWYLTEFNVIVEFFGLLNKDYYLIKVEEKREICRNNNIKLLEITERGANNSLLKDIFSEYM